MYHYSKLLLITICILYLHFSPGQCTIEFREDFSGEGDLQTQTDYNGVKGGVLTTDAQSIYYGQILTPTETFAGLKAVGQSSYFVATDSHSLRIRNSQDLNATAKILSAKDEGGNKTESTFFSAQGEGNVRERVLSQGKFSRPVDLSSLFHSGKFKLNSTTKEAVA